MALSIVNTVFIPKSVLVMHFKCEIYYEYCSNVPKWSWKILFVSWKSPWLWSSWYCGNMRTVNITPAWNYKWENLQQCEWNYKSNIVLFNTDKNRAYGGSASIVHRVAAAVSQKNLGHGWVSQVYTHVLHGAVVCMRGWKYHLSLMLASIELNFLQATTNICTCNLSVGKVFFFFTILYHYSLRTSIFGEGKLTYKCTGNLSIGQVPNKKANKYQVLPSLACFWYLHVMLLCLLWVLWCLVLQFITQSQHRSTPLLFSTIVQIFIHLYIHTPICSCITHDVFVVLLKKVILHEQILIFCGALLIFYESFLSIIHR
jgi:hypothetical protein